MADLSADEIIQEIQNQVRRARGFETLLDALDKYKSIDGAIANKQAICDDLDAQAQTKRDELKDYASNFEGLEAKLAARLADIDAQEQNALAATNARVDKYRKESLQAVQDQIDTAQAKLDGLNRAIVAKTQESNNLTAEIGQFTSKLENLKGKLAVIKDAI